MSSIPATPKRDRWAHLRFSIVGPLLAAPPQPGLIYDAIRDLAAKTWRHPVSGTDVRFATATIERWFYAARNDSDPVSRLRDRRRGNRGTFRSLAPAVIAALRAQYDAHPGWTVQLHFDNLKVAVQGTALPSYPTLRRYLLAHGMHRQARLMRTSAGALAARDRLEQLEVRSYEVEHVNALWHLDFHHGSRKVLTSGGEWVKPMLLGVIDCCRRRQIDPGGRNSLTQENSRTRRPHATPGGSARVRHNWRCGSIWYRRQRIEFIWRSGCAEPGRRLSSGR